MLFKAVICREKFYTVPQEMEISSMARSECLKVRLNEEELADLFRLTLKYGNRSEAVRRALALLVKTEQQSETPQAA